MRWPNIKTSSYIDTPYCFQTLELWPLGTESVEKKSYFQMPVYHKLRNKTAGAGKSDSGSFSLVRQGNLLVPKFYVASGYDRYNLCMD